MASTINATPTSSGLISTADNSGVLALQTGGTTGLTVNTVQGVQALNCIGVGNATPSTSGAGITFPVTQSASADANTLDDYEEGTWTPTALGSGTAGTGTYTIQSGAYTKVGRLITVWGRIGYSSHTGTGNILIGNFPFTTSANYFAGSVGFRDGFTMPALTQMLLQTNISATTMYPLSILGGTSNASTITIPASISDFLFSVTYFTT